MFAIQLNYSYYESLKYDRESGEYINGENRQFYPFGFCSMFSNEEDAIKWIVIKLTKIIRHTLRTDNYNTSNSPLMEHWAYSDDKPSLIDFEEGGDTFLIFSRGDTADPEDVLRWVKYENISLSMLIGILNNYWQDKNFHTHYSCWIKMIREENPDDEDLSEFNDLEYYNVELKKDEDKETGLGNDIIYTEKLFVWKQV